MPNGTPHDHPISDILIHDMHPFPLDIEQLIRELSQWFDIFDWAELDPAPFDWQKGKYLDEARVLLGALIQNHGDPDARRRHMQEYWSKTGGTKA